MNRSSHGVSQWAKSMASLRRYPAQVVSMEQGQEHDIDELQLFHSHLADKLISLLPSPSDDPNHHILSIPFISKLLDIVIACADEFDSLFSLISSRSPGVVSKPPLDRAVNDLLDRCVKSLDVCNSVSLCIDSLRHWRRHADIAVAALGPLRQAGQVNRARRALFKLRAILPPDPHDTGGCGSGASRAWSFGRGSSTGCKDSPQGRRLSWSVSWSWSSSPRQFLAISAGLSAPRGVSCGGGGDADGGLAAALAFVVYAMNAVLVLAMSALASAFPCHEYCSITSPQPPPRQLPWATAMAWLQDLVAEEWKMSNAGGRTAGSTLAEVQAMARCARGIIKGLGEDTGTATTTSAMELNSVAALTAELGEVCGRVEDEIGPLENKVRQVFRRFVETRAEVQKCLQSCSASQL